MRMNSSSDLQRQRQLRFGLGSWPEELQTAYAPLSTSCGASASAHSLQSQLAAPPMMEKSRLTMPTKLGGIALGADGGRAGPTQRTHVRSECANTRTTRRSSMLAEGASTGWQPCTQHTPMCQESASSAIAVDECRPQGLADIPEQPSSQLLTCRAWMRRHSCLMAQTWALRQTPQPQMHTIHLTERRHQQFRDRYPEVRQPQHQQRRVRQPQHQMPRDWNPAVVRQLQHQPPRDWHPEPASEAQIKLRGTAGRTESLQLVPRWSTIGRDLTSDLL